MKKTKRIISVFLCSICAFMMLFCNVSCLNVDTYLEGKTYNSVEELHEDLIATMQISPDVDESFFPKEMLHYFLVEDIVVVISPYSRELDGELVQNELYVYFIKEKDGQYELLTPIYGWGQWAKIKLGYEYTLGGNYYYFANVKVDNEETSICFLYKRIDETRSIYFDGKKTNEIEMTNPFDGTQFLLCYGLSKTDTFFDQLTRPIDQRHTVALQ